MSIKWTLPVLALVLAAASQAVVTAQVRQPIPVPGQPNSLHQPMSLPKPAPYTSRNPTTQPEKRPMPQPGRDAPGRISLMPTILHTYAGKLVSATREEGDITYHYEGSQIVQEEIGHTRQSAGNYKYDRHGRFDRIEYTDGSSIIARYSDHNELRALTASGGRSIGFQLADDAEIRMVTPTVNPLAFHSAVAVLRMRAMPELLLRPLQEFLKNEKGDGPIIVSPSPVPNPPPEGEQEDIPTVYVPGKRLAPDEGPSPIDFIPIGGNCCGGGGGGSIQDATDFAVDVYLKKNCLVGCNARTTYLTRVCETGPTYADQAECHQKVQVHWTNRCQVACLTKDYQHRWTLDFPEPNYAPWRKDGKL